MNKASVTNNLFFNAEISTLQKINRLKNQNSTVHGNVKTIIFYKQTKKKKLGFFVP